MSTVITTVIDSYLCAEGESIREPEPRETGFHTTGGSMNRLNVYVDSDLHLDFKRACIDAGDSMSNVVENLIEGYVHEHHFGTKDYRDNLRNQIRRAVLAVASLVLENAERFGWKEYDVDVPDAIVPRIYEYKRKVFDRTGDSERELTEQISWLKALASEIETGETPDWLSLS